MMRLINFFIAAHISQFKEKLDASYANLLEHFSAQKDPQEEAKQWKAGTERAGVKRYDKILSKTQTLSASQLSYSKTKVVVNVPIDKMAEFMLDTTKAPLYDSYYDGTNMLADLSKFMKYDEQCKPKDTETELVTRSRLLHLKYKGFLVVGYAVFIFCL